MQKISRTASPIVAPPPAAPTNRAVGLTAQTPETVDYRGYFKSETYPNNSVIYRPGDPADKVYLLRSGRVRLIRIGKGSTRSVLAILRPGDLFGEMLRPEGTQVEELSVASGEAEVWSIDGRSFQQLIEGRPHLAVDVIRALNERMRAMKRRVTGLTFKEVPARLAETLLTLAETHGDRCPHGGEHDLKGITQQDLADLVGASRSFVSTLINEMKRDGHLGNVGRTLCIKDMKSLRKLASREK
ncbi:Crp/Fnr family transcriptional regulator [Vulgatibacter incomptus]|uniref:cAMP-binding protein n=1 Tax=Vulgatibacter incomptus TaxID=1391653 RepID=A0A0K1PCX5_9BACT|nr:Crp/Fnr family transcriptional regulator [Vulgatibacter incomptus]AKU91393.1 cAMP-binding protein [Vulgatibacter incomptus]